MRLWLLLSLVTLAMWSTACSQCKADPGCPNAHICFGGECRPYSGQAVCTSHDECEAGLRCDSGSCVRRPVPCSGDGDCRGGETCMADRCVHAARACFDDRECDLGALCVAYECSEDEACTGDFACDVDELCEDDRCQRFDCEDSGECPRGECIDGACVE